jgi:hypothetical protein
VALRYLLRNWYFREAGRRSSSTNL